MNQISEQSAHQNEELPTENIYLDRKFRYGFLLSELGFLIPQGAVSMLIEEASIFSIPNTINWLKGLVNVRGTMVPVFDLGAMLETELKPSKNMTMVITLGKRSMAFTVDSGQSLNEADLSLTKTSIPQQLNEFTEKVYQVGQTNWIEFDFIKCLNHFENRISI